MNQKTWKKIAAVGMCVCMTAGIYCLLWKKKEEQEDPVNL